MTAPAPAAPPPSPDDSRPRSPDIHLIATAAGRHALVVDGSRLFDLDHASYARLDGALDGGGLGAAMAELGLVAPVPAVDDAVPAGLPVRALSLAIAQACNLGCTYCYAREGEFGGAPKAMPLDTALAAVDLLIDGTAPGERVNLAFLGGEPLANRAVLRRAAAHARGRARARGQAIGFSITTNGTLVTPGDADFFDDYGFAVTVSVDGGRAAHDRLRPFKNGRGSFDTVMERVAPLLARRGALQVTARVTVTPSNLDLPGTLDGLLALGFHGVGFSPMLASPSGAGEMDAGGLGAMLEGMTACGRAYEERAMRGEPYRFSNMTTALAEIHRGTHRPYPCGAGAGYLGVSADGDLAACHRFVGDPAGGMGNLGLGVDEGRRNLWLQSRHVHRQEPCRSCWARYLCGGGCHHEVIARGRRSCDYIRGWLHYCLQAYLRLSAARPELFAAGAAPWAA